MIFVTKAFFWGYVAFLVVVGASGIFIARWELAKVFAIPLESAGARLLSVFVDGPPSTVFVVRLVLEVVTGVLVLLAGPLLAP